LAQERRNWNVSVFRWHAPPPQGGVPDAEHEMKEQSEIDDRLSEFEFVM
jgi:hypothetical protein